MRVAKFAASESCARRTRPLNRKLRRCLAHPMAALGYSSAWRTRISSISHACRSASFTLQCYLRYTGFFCKRRYNALRREARSWGDRRTSSQIGYRPHSLLWLSAASCERGASRYTRTVEVSKIGVASLAFEDRYQFVGPAPDAGLDARILAMGGEWSTLRSDGLIVAHTRCILTTAEDRPIFVHYAGACNVGDASYEALLEGDELGSAQLDIALRFHTSASGFCWLNRTPCFGTGERDYARATLNLALFSLSASNRADD